MVVFEIFAQTLMVGNLNSYLSRRKSLNFQSKENSIIRLVLVGFGLRYGGEKLHSMKGPSTAVIHTDPQSRLRVPTPNS